jgi:hypothetical protein
MRILIGSNLNQKGEIVLKKFNVLCLSAVFLLGVMLNVSFAAETIESLTKRIEVLEKDKSAAGVSDLVSNLKINGFVDASFVYDDNAETNSFSLDKVVLYGAYAPVDYAGLFFDVGFENVDSDGAGVLDQGYVTLTAPLGSGLTFTLGKFDAPIGYELVDAPDMYQFSHALVFDFGLPTSFTGLKADTTVADMLDITGYVVNGWDVDSDNNKAKTGGGRLGLRPVKGINLGVSYAAGAEQDDDNDNLRQVVDVDLTIDAVENLTIGGELNWGSEEEASLTEPGEDANWFGALAMLHYDFTDWCGFTVRYDYFEDKDGARFENGLEETRQAITLAPTFTIYDSFGALVEYRYDKSDEDTFEKEDGTFTDDNSTLAVEFTYSF